jgi:hypothetical protein
MAIPPIIQQRPTIDSSIRRTNQFVKSSTDAFQDPVFLTFRVDFLPIPEEYPKSDGLYNSSLFGPVNTGTKVERLNGQPLGIFSKNSRVEFSAYDWLSDYYGNSFVGSGELGTPAQSLLKAQVILEYLQENPWYFQSIQGIGDLWKTAHRVKEGNKKTTLTFSCLESIEQHLTDLAENYRYAVYDQERLSYRLPDNLRWFDMVIDLVEIRDLVDYSGEFFTRGANGQLTRGLKVLQFRCKMCEFDFSDFLGGAQSDHKIYTEDKPFSPSFKVNVGWVIQQEIPVQEAAELRDIGMFGGALSSLSNRLSRFLQNASRLPGALAGSVLNEIQTRVDSFAMGNVYSDVNQFEQRINNLPGALTGRRPAVGPNLGGSVGLNPYPPAEAPREIRASIPNDTSDLGDAYP